ncbi:hypothetical protein D3C77_365760 [compost metagenome]
MIPNLLDRLKELTIDDVFYSGSRDWYCKNKGKKNEVHVLNDLRDRVIDGESRLQRVIVGASSLIDAEPEKWEPLWTTETGNVWAYVIAANTLRNMDSKNWIGKDSSILPSKKPDTDAANATSLCIYLKMFNVGAVILGDATFTTFQFITDVVERNSSWITEGFMIQAPHHGSRRTTFNAAPNAAIKKENAQVIDNVAFFLSGSTVVASAGNEHGHPSLETVGYFLKYARKGPPWWKEDILGDEHFVTAYIDMPLYVPAPTLNTYRTYQTSENFYTTQYHLGTNKKHSHTPDKSFRYPPYQAVEVSPVGPFAEGMNWIYKVDQNSTPEFLDLQGVPNLRRLIPFENLLALFNSSPGQVMDQASVPEPPLPPPPSAGTARAPARAQRLLRRLTPRT